MSSKKGVIHPPELNPDTLNLLMDEIRGSQRQMLETEDELCKIESNSAGFGQEETNRGTGICSMSSCKVSNSERLDVIEERPRNSAFMLHNMGRQSLSTTNSPIENFVSEEKKILSLREKQKGNECFKAGDFKEAIRYYSNSITISPNSEAFNNRGLAYLKEGAFLHCISDCGKVLCLEPSNVKALLRCGIAHSKLENREMALNVFSKVLHLEPTNTLAKREMEKFEMKLVIPEVKRGSLISKSKNKPLIEEI